MNKCSVSALPWGITRTAFASFANVVAIVSFQAVFDLANYMPILSTSVMAMTIGGNGNMQKSINSS